MGMDFNTQENEMPGRVERRNHIRFLVKPGVFAVLGPYSFQMGQIVDISEGGLAFQYKQGKEESADTYEVSILFDGKSDNNTSPFKFTGKAISDVEVRGTNPFSTAVIKRFSIEFENLTYYQQAWLSECIRNHTIGKVDSVPAP
jgi:hypothetical protein